jgi:phosphoribosyl 1,2-cyclic phosphate phosphodiesterase
MHRLKLLGTGTSTGVPVPGCSCPVCRSTNPHNYRDRTSALITLATGPSILIDASPDLRQQSLRHAVARVDAVLFTHSHADHILGTDDLRCFNFVQGHRIPCYGTEFTLTRLRQTFPYIFTPDPSYEGGLLAQLDLLPLFYGAPLSLFGLDILPFELRHGSSSVAGFRFGEIGYATDCNFLTEGAYEALKGCRVLFLDALRYKPHKTHFTIEQALSVAAEIKAEQTYFIHMTHAIEHDAVNARLPEGVALAYDGLEIEFQ